MNFLDIIHLICRSFGLRLLITDGPDQDFSMFDYGFRQRILGADYFAQIKAQIFEALRPNVLFYLQDEFELYYYAFSMPPNQTQTVFIGPFLYRQPQKEQHAPHLSQFQLREQEKEEFQAYLRAVPIVSEAAPLQSLLTGLFSGLYPEKGFSFIPAKLNEPASMYGRRPQTIADTGAGFAAMHLESRYYTIQQLLKETASGNTAKATDCLRSVLKYQENCPTSQQFHQMRILSRELNVLLCHRALQEKVNAVSCENAYQRFTGQIEACHTDDQLETLLFDAISDYSGLIRDAARLQYSDLIRNCMNHIDLFFSEPLTLSTEARRLNVSVCHLSTQFSKEAGISFTSYVNHVRIRYSCVLLENLKMSIQRVAELSGFSGSNYFARVFRQMVGTTPTGFRAKMQKRSQLVVSSP